MIKALLLEKAGKKCLQIDGIIQKALKVGVWDLIKSQQKKTKKTTWKCCTKLPETSLKLELWTEIYELILSCYFPADIHSFIPETDSLKSCTSHEKNPFGAL